MQWALMAQIALVTAGASAIRPMISYQAIDHGASGAQLGLLATTFSFLPVLVAFSVGRRIDQHGPVRFLIAGAAVSVAGTALALVTPGLALLYVATAALGLGLLLSLLAQQAAVAVSAAAGERDRAFGRLSSATAVGLIAGPPAATFTATYADRLGQSQAVVGLAVGLLLAIASLVVAWLLRHASIAGSEGRSADPTHLLAARIVRTRGMWQALLAGGTVLATLDLLSAFLPLWANDRGIPIGVVGLLLTLRGVFTLIARLGSETLIRRLGRRALLAGSMLAAAGGLVALTFVDVVGGAIVMLVLGVGLGMAQPLTMSWITAVAAPGTRGAALGMRVTANRIGQATLPAAIAAVAAGSGANGVFWGAALVLSGASVAMARAPMERPTET